MGRAFWWLGVFLTIILMMAWANAHGENRKAFVREVTREVDQFNTELEAYRAADHSGYDPGAVALYITRGEWDLALVGDAVKAYRHHQVTKEDVESMVSQLSRDMEDVPEVQNAGSGR